MSDEDQVTLPPPDDSPKKPKRSRDRNRETGKTPAIPDPESAHKKFMAIMIGLFLLVLLIMIIFQEHFDFMTDGGI